MTDEELKEKIVKEQDIFCTMALRDFGIGGKYIDGELKGSYNQLIKLIENDSETLSKLSLKNVLKVMGACSKYKDEDYKVMQDVISQKLDTEEILFEDAEDTGFALVLQHKQDKMISLFGKENREKMISMIKASTQEIKEAGLGKAAASLTLVADFANLRTYVKQGIFNEEKINQINAMVDKNPKALEYANLGIFKDEIYNSFAPEFIETLSKFPDLSQKVIALQSTNPELFDYYAKEINSYESIVDHYNDIKDMTYTFTKNAYNIQGEINKEKIDEWMNTVLARKNDPDFPVEYSENYRQKVEDYYKAQYDKKANGIEVYSNALESARAKYAKALEVKQNPEGRTRDELISAELSLMNFEESVERYEGLISENQKAQKEINFKRKYLMDFKEADKLIEEYAGDIENLEGLDDSTRNFFRKLKSDRLNFLDVEPENIRFQENEEYINPKDINQYKKNISDECAKSYISGLTYVKDKISNSIEAKDENYKQVELDGQKIDVVKMNGKMDLFIHSTNTGFLENREISEDFDFKQQWENGGDKTSHVLSTAYINQEFMGMPPVANGGVMYAFASIPKENIRIMGTSDINTYSKDFGFDSSTKQYMSAKTMQNSTRRVYSEFAIEKTTPDYVLLMDDASEDVRTNTFKAAKDFGIPVVMIDKKEIETQQVNNLNSMLDEFDKTKNPELLGKIINRYETNGAGWLLNRKEGIDESYTKDVNNDRFKDDFDVLGNKIQDTITNYLEEVKNNPELSADGVVTIAKTMLQEKALYELSEKAGPDKKISGVQMMLNQEDIIKNVNETLESKGMQDYVVGEDTKFEDYVKLVDVAKYAVCNVRTNEIEVKEMEQVIQKQMEEQEKNIENQAIGADE